MKLVTLFVRLYGRDYTSVAISVLSVDCLQHFRCPIYAKFSTYKFHNGSEMDVGPTPPLVVAGLCRVCFSCNFCICCLWHCCFNTFFSPWPCGSFKVCHSVYSQPKLLEPDSFILGKELLNCPAISLLLLALLLFNPFSFSRMTRVWKSLDCSTISSSLLSLLQLALQVPWLLVYSASCILAKGYAVSCWVMIKDCWCFCLGWRLWSLCEENIICPVLEFSTAIPLSFMSFKTLVVERCAE